MIKRLDLKDISSISYDYETSLMEIFNHKKLLIFRKVMTEEKFNKSVCKLIGGRENK